VNWNKTHQHTRVTLSLPTHFTQSLTLDHRFSRIITTTKWPQMTAIMLPYIFTFCTKSAITQQRSLHVTVYTLCVHWWNHSVGTGMPAVTEIGKGEGGLHLDIYITLHYELFVVAKVKKLQGPLITHYLSKGPHPPTPEFLVSLLIL